MTNLSQRLLLAPAAILLAATTLAGCGGDDPKPSTGASEPVEAQPSEAPPSPTVLPDEEMAVVMADLKSDLDKTRTAIEAGEDPIEGQFDGSIELSEGNLISVLNQTSPTEFRVCVLHEATTAWADYSTDTDKVRSKRLGGCPE